MDTTKKEIITTDTILNYLIEAVELKIALNPEIWLDSAFKLNLLLIQEEKEMIELERAYNQKVNDIMQSQEKINVAAAEKMAILTDEYMLYREKLLKIKRVEQLILIAKKRSDRAAGF